jgi:hypothetical protein
MKNFLLTAAALALLSTTAQAASKPYTFYQGTYWETFGFASNNDGVPMCGMQTGAGVYAIYIKWTPDSGMAIQVWKKNWRLANDTKVLFQLAFFDNAKPGESDAFTAEAGFARSTEGTPRARRCS